VASRDPFYRRWECGELSRDELTAYAGEYRHAVVALADTAEQATPLAGSDHAGEERAHVDLWDDFVSAVDAQPGPARLEGTTKCVTAWTSADPLGVGDPYRSRRPWTSETSSTA
jgi:hypothetical protein